PVRVERAEDALPLNDFPKRPQDSAGGLLRDQLRVVDAGGGVVEDDDEVMPALIAEPLVLAGVNVQEHAGKWPARPSLAVRPASGLTLDEARALEHALRPRVAHRDGVLGGELLVEVADVEVEVALAVEPQDLFEHAAGHAAGTSPTAPPVEEGVEAEALILLLPAAHVSGADA